MPTLPETTSVILPVFQPVLLPKLFFSEPVISGKGFLSLLTGEVLRVVNQQFSFNAVLATYRPVRAEAVTYLQDHSSIT